MVFTSQIRKLREDALARGDHETAALAAVALGFRVDNKRMTRKRMSDAWAACAALLKEIA